MRDIETRLRAQKMRRSGNSIHDIAVRLSVPKSTVSMWCRDIILSPLHIRALERKQRERSHVGSLRAAELKRKVRIDETKLQKQQGAEDIGTLDKRDLLLLGMGLYWGEGYKYGNSELGFTNSDPHMIRMFLRWMKDVYDIHPRDLVLRVSINMLYQSKAHTAIDFWSKITKTSPSQFTMTSLIKTKLRKFRKKDGQDYHGTLRVKVRRATRLHRRILGSIEHIARSV